MPVKLSTPPPETPAAKSPEAKFNLMRPEMPHIPGVEKTRSARKTGGGFSLDEDQRRKLMGGALGAGVLLVILILWWAINKPKAGAHPSADSDSSGEETTANSQPAPSAQIQEGPTVAATTEELSKPWSSKEFIFSRPLTRENIEAMVIRLPGGGLWAFSLRDPFGHCRLEFVKDVAAIASTYGYNASHPMVVNPCDRTIYDPLKVGSLGGDTYARGGIVQGGGLRPPLAIDVKVDGHSIVADGIE
jgi:hypothetical protein